MPRKKKLQVVDKLDKKLLNLKSGDHFIVEMYWEGTRFCEVKLGYKHARIKPLFGSPIGKKLTARRARELLAKTYWTAASTDALYLAWEKGRKHRPKNWERNYK